MVYDRNEYKGQNTGNKISILDEVTELNAALDDLMEYMGEVQYLLDRLGDYSVNKNYSSSGDALQEAYETGEILYDAMDTWVDSVTELVHELELAGYISTTQFRTQKNTNIKDTTVAKIVKHLRSIGEPVSAEEAGKILQLYNSYFK